MVQVFPKEDEADVTLQVTAVTDLCPVIGIVWEVPWSENSS